MVAALCCVQPQFQLYQLAHATEIKSIQLHDSIVGLSQKIVSFTLLTLHYITLHYITLHYITLHYITLHYITFHHISLHCIALHYITLHYITLHYITLHIIKLHYIPLHYITLHYNTLQYITLHYITCFWTGSVRRGYMHWSRLVTLPSFFTVSPWSAMLNWQWKTDLHFSSQFTGHYFDTDMFFVFCGYYNIRLTFNRSVSIVTRIRIRVARLCSISTILDQRILLYPNRSDERM